MIFFANGPFATPAVTYIGPRCRRGKAKCQGCRFIKYSNVDVRPTQARVAGGSTPAVVFRCLRRACFLGGGGAALSSPRTGDRDCVAILICSRDIGL